MQINRNRKMILEPEKQDCAESISHRLIKTRAWYSRASIGFTREGFDEMDEVSGDGYAELLDDGSIEIEFAFHNGDEADLKAKRNTSSTAC